MLLEFSVSNYLSFRDKKTLCLEPTSITDFKDNCIENGRYSGLKSIVLYGANASGKSNLIKAMSVMKEIIRTSTRNSSTDEINVTPFLLNAQNQNQPSFFEIVFIYESVKYRYGFEVDKKSVQYEWLFETTAKTEKELFLRTPDGIEVKSAFKEGKGLEERTRDNALFLPIVDQFNGQISKKIMLWLNNWNTISGLSHEQYRTITFNLFEKDIALKEFIKRLDLGIKDLKLKKVLFDSEKLKTNIPEDLVKQIITDLQGKTIVEILAEHDVLNENGEVIGQIDFDLRSQESSGTNKIFDISGPIFDTIKNGGILVIDELDAKLHPLMTNSIVNLFNSKALNPKNAQLIFATHNTNLLSNGKFRRDQIYFLEKDNFNSTDLYSLIEYKEGNAKVRKDRSFEKDYINGKYGAIPFIGDFNELFK